MAKEKVVIVAVYGEKAGHSTNWGKSTVAERVSTVVTKAKEIDVLQDGGVRQMICCLSGDGFRDQFLVVLETTPEGEAPICDLLNENFGCKE